MTRETLIASAGSDLYAICQTHNSSLTENAVTGCLNLINSTGWLAVPPEEGVTILRDAMLRYCADHNLYG